MKMLIADRIAIFLLIFYTALRPLGTGLDTAEPETFFLAIIAVAALAVSWGASLYYTQKIVLPARALSACALVFAIFAALAVHTAGSGGYQQIAIDLGWNWLADGAVFLALLNLLARCRLQKTFFAAILAALALTAAFGLYQRFYGLDYLRSVLNTEAAAAMSQLGEAFGIRLGSNRISGQFAYANALAGFVVMLLPLTLAFFYRRPGTAAADSAGYSRTSSYFWGGLIGASLLVLVYSGSKAGFLAAKILELAIFVCIAGDRTSPAKHPRLLTVFTIAGWLTLSTLLTLFLAAIASRLYPASSLPAQTLLALLWGGELWLIGRWAAKNPGICGQWARRLGMTLSLLTILGGGAAALWLTSPAAAARVAAIAPPAAAVRLEKLRTEIHKQLGVRGNYWKSALQMVQARPLSGFGLDNFGVYYSQFKQADGWEVRRAHNLYLQLAVDGGLGLLLAFAGFWVFFFTARRPADSALSGSETPASALGQAAGISAFALTYLLFYCGAFTGLGVEFFFSELYRFGGKNFSQAALAIHTAVNWLILPGVWLLTFRAALRTPAAEPARWLPLMLGAALFHFFFDFHYYQAINSGFFWVLAALALNARSQIWEWRIPLRAVQPALAGLIVVAAAVIFFGLQPQFHANVARGIAEKLAFDNNPENLKNISAMNDAALAGRPGDVSLHLSRATVLSLRGELGAAVQALRTAVALNPQSTGNQVHLAQLLASAPFLPEQRKKEIQSLYRNALRLYPLKGKYRALYADFLRRHGMTDPHYSIRELAQSALDLSAATTDEAARLTVKEQELAEKLAQ